jgi:hypothetical protein
MLISTCCRSPYLLCTSLCLCVCVCVCVCAMCVFCCVPGRCVVLYDGSLLSLLLLACVGSIASSAATAAPAAAATAAAAGRGGCGVRGGRGGCGGRGGVGRWRACKAGRSSRRCRGGLVLEVHPLQPLALHNTRQFMHVRLPYRYKFEVSACVGCCVTDHLLWSSCVLRLAT